MTDTQKEALARLKVLSKQANPDDLSEVYPLRTVMWEVPPLHMDDVRFTAEAIVTDSLSVYAVGSYHNEFGKMIYDRVYGPADLDKAIAYCESRKSDKYEWCVFEAPLGGDYGSWRMVHKTERSR
jgi:hypothetical protein